MDAEKAARKMSKEELERLLVIYSPIRKHSPTADAILEQIEDELNNREGS